MMTWLLVAGILVTNCYLSALLIEELLTVLART
ncbi:hypothetical protein C497_00105 [Halalkalicoccus jeotgali B3]|uniref:Uncharacterized protein n=1 Tax=Halalkalicoccus jeotgali (strain DSM 18796 / CECT 7217 / JCM 14584 / KCTC 4019 / B3) TaxID=795797 RepID=D8JD93_HALJB|nr:hypothetical protein HacjB3_19553 [Halalkalicoccus jeotgali B3]ELY41957.1 hypothetical protein C497_00105 [Halalkalicoccus jeotgali B3]